MLLIVNTCIVMEHRGTYRGNIEIGKGLIPHSYDHNTPVVNIEFTRGLIFPDWMKYVSVVGDIKCYEMDRLDNSPKDVSGCFILHRYRGDSLEGMPQFVGKFTCWYSQLTSLRGISKFMLDCHIEFNDQLDSLEGMGGVVIKGDLNISNNKIRSIEGMAGCRVDGRLSINTHRYCKVHGLPYYSEDDYRDVMGSVGEVIG